MITVTNLRKIFTEQGIKGASKWKREDFESAIIAAEFAAIAEDAARKPVVAEVAKGMCIICGVRKGMSAKTRREQGLGKDFSDQCLPCYTEGGWENAHSDSAHDAMNLAALTEEQAVEVHGCWICYPELNEAKMAPRTGRSRLGMEIVAKGTEIHKSQTFKVAAEAAGWTVTMMSETYELDEDATGEGTRYYATATRGESHISLAWDGRAYDYPASGASFNGKARKVRNLKEALRLL
jgi:hypothetical protein